MLLTKRTIGEKLYAGMGILLLLTVIDKFSGGPVGVETLSSARRSSNELRSLRSVSMSSARPFTVVLATNHTMLTATASPRASAGANRTR